MHSRTAVLMIAVISLASCKESFVIKTHINRGNIDVTFHEYGILTDSQFEPCVTSLQVYKRDIKGPSKVWDIRAPAGSCVKAKRLTLGMTPKGFLQNGAFVPLAHGAKYTIDAHDQSRRIGAGDFKFAG